MLAVFLMRDLEIEIWKLSKSVDFVQCLQWFYDGDAFFRLTKKMPPPGIVKNHRMKSFSANLTGSPRGWVAATRQARRAARDAQSAINLPASVAGASKGHRRMNSIYEKKPPKKSNLEKWLSDPRADDYFGKSFSFKLSILAQVRTGDGTLAAIAREHHVCKQAATRHAAKARSIFGSSPHLVDS